MNQAQFGLFLVYVLSVFFSGAGIYSFLDKDHKTFMNKSICLGELLLLGGIFIVGELFILSLAGLYKVFFLWLIVFLNYSFLCNKETRDCLAQLAKRKTSIDLPLLAFVLLLLVFVYRNCYFMVDVDSLMTYSFTQKVWLASGTSLIGDATYNPTFFSPQFDTISSGLGISLFGQETLFAQMINIFWRVIVLILVFGYTSYRFNRYYGLAAAVFVCLNDHFFFSGVNRWVLINGAVIAFLFAAAYNFWEARKQDSPFRLLLALIFLFQMLANKIQIVYIFLFLLVIGIWIQRGVLKKIKEIIFNRRWLIAGFISVIFVLLWYFKNLILTGNPVFPVLAGVLGTFGFTPEQGKVFYKVVSGVDPGLFLKYMNYLFIWPGINASKIVITAISFMSLFLFLLYSKDREDKGQLKELFFWLSVCILAVAGTSIACHWEPRYHRYPIAIMAFTAVASIHFMFNAIGVRSKFIIGIVMLLLAFKGSFNEGYKVILDSGGFFMRPSFKENADVLLDKIHMDYAVRKVYPEMSNINNSLRENDDKVGNSAWDAMSFNYPLFLLPVRPLVSPWHSTTINWNSYKSAAMVVGDLKKHGIDWIMQMKNGKLIFIPINEYALEIVKFNKHPTMKYATYDLPPELSNVYW